MSEKLELLDNISLSYEESKNLDRRFLVITLLFMIIALVLIFPKIYIASNIYFESIKINKLKKELKILVDENKHLNQKIEHKKFKDASENP